MNNRDLKQMLISSFQLEKELIDFCEDALTHIYGDRAKGAIEAFQDGLDWMNPQWHIRSFADINDEILKNETAKQERIKKEAEREAEESKFHS